MGLADLSPPILHRIVQHVNSVEDRRVLRTVCRSLKQAAESTFRVQRAHLLVHRLFDAVQIELISERGDKDRPPTLKSRGNNVTTVKHPDEILPSGFFDRPIEVPNWTEVNRPLTEDEGSVVSHYFDLKFINVIDATFSKIAISAPNWTEFVDSSAKECKFTFLKCNLREVPLISIAITAKSQKTLLFSNCFFAPPDKEDDIVRIAAGSETEIVFTEEYEEKDLIALTEVLPVFRLVPCTWTLSPKPDHLGIFEGMEKLTVLGVNDDSIARLAAWKCIRTSESEIMAVGIMRLINEVLNIKNDDFFGTIYVARSGAFKSVFENPEGILKSGILLPCRNKFTDAADMFTQKYRFEYSNSSIHVDVCAVPLGNGFNFYVKSRPKGSKPPNPFADPFAEFISATEKQAIFDALPDKFKAK